VKKKENKGKKTTEKKKKNLMEKIGKKTKPETNFELGRI